jgi:Rho termination factor, N-terminal domain
VPLLGTILNRQPKNRSLPGKPNYQITNVQMKLQDLKAQMPAELVSFAEEKGVENASTMPKQELMFAILKQLAIQETDNSVKLTGLEISY